MDLTDLRISRPAEEGAPLQEDGQALPSPLASVSAFHLEIHFLCSTFSRFRLLLLVSCLFSEVHYFFVLFTGKYYTRDKLCRVLDHVKL